MEPLNTPTYVRLREQIRDDIAEGVWALGTHVTLAQMVKRYETSANPVREALLQLQGEGIVDMQIHRGAVIPRVDASYVSNIYDLRGALEQMLAAKVAMIASPADLDVIEQARMRHEEAARSGDIRDSVVANRDFHRCFNAVAGNQPALDVLASRASLVDALRRSIGYGGRRLEVVVQQHKKLVTAIKRGDVAAASKAALEHAESAREDLLERLAQR